MGKQKKNSSVIGKWECTKRLLLFTLFDVFSAKAGACARGALAALDGRLSVGWTAVLLARSRCLAAFMRRGGFFGGALLLLRCLRTEGGTNEAFGTVSDQILSARVAECLTHKMRVFGLGVL